MHMEDIFQNFAFIIDLLLLLKHNIFIQLGREASRRPVRRVLDRRVRGLFGFLFELCLVLYCMDSSDKHDLGYWMSIFGFALVVFVGLFYGFVSNNAEVAFWVVVFGFVVFVVGAELALRNQKHLKIDEE